MMLENVQQMYLTRSQEQIINNYATIKIKSSSAQLPFISTALNFFVNIFLCNIPYWGRDAFKLMKTIELSDIKDAINKTDFATPTSRIARSYWGVIEENTRSPVRV